MATRLVKHLAVLLLWVAAVTVCIAWLSVVLLPEETDPYDADYMWRPLKIDGVTRGVLGLAATAVAVAIAVALLRGFTQGALSRNWLAAFIAGGTIAAYGGLTYTAVTAPVIGANIGGGIMLLFAGPVVVATVIVAIAIARSGRRTSAG